MLDELEDIEDSDNYLHDSDIDEYYIMQSAKLDKNNLWRYSVYNYADEKVATWLSRINALELDEEQWEASMIKNIFDREVREAIARNDKGVHDLAKGNYRYQSQRPVYQQTSIFDNDVSTHTSTSSHDYYSNYYRPIKKTTGLAKDLKNSDTLVIHCADNSTNMLKQVYYGKGWDVLRDGNIDKDELHELLDCHDRIVMLGHGSGYGLMNPQGGSSVITSSEVPYLKNKKLFVIWCNADKFFEKAGIGRGMFITKNAPSEVWECKAAGCGKISTELMLENITYWCKLCGDVVEQCLNGDVQSGVDYIREKYLEQYGNHPVTIFNADSAHSLGTDVPLPAYTFKGTPLTEKDFPIPNFDEEKFLENPTADATKCPQKDIA